MPMSSPAAASPNVEANAASGSLTDKPVPRLRKSASHLAQVQVQNRRRDYLQRHPSYFDNIEHELADPILYERLVKRHQSAAEREAEGRAKGYGRTLEADLVRGETKLATLRDAQEPSPAGGLEEEEAWHQPAESKAQGLELWRLFLTDRFVRGRDAEFAYEAVDGSEEYDGLARREAEEQWFDDEEPMKVEDAALLKGETGIQDF
ncbi:hypothetical protein MY4824_008427 [Beauveria thailandica]